MKRTQPRCSRLAEAEKQRTKAPQRSEQGAEISDQQGVGEQLEPLVEVPEPFGDVGAEIGP